MNELCTVTIADIYGAEWMSANREELDRKWEWSFGVEHTPCQFANAASEDIIPVNGTPLTGPRIILHRRKPKPLKPPTLREVYRVDKVKIPVGWEWTGEWRVPVREEFYVTDGTKIALQVCSPYIPAKPRLILRERPKKVWFKAEEKARKAKVGDWFWSHHDERWIESDRNFLNLYICATRHEDIDQMVQVVTQADVDRVVKV